MVDVRGRASGSFAFRGVIYGIAISALMWMAMISGVEYWTW